MIRLALFALLLTACQHAASPRDTTPALITSPRAYQEVLKAAPSNPPNAQTLALAGRILRGKSSADFMSLTADPNRKMIFVIGDDGLTAFLRLSDAEKLQRIGYPTDYVERLRKEGTQFKLAVFSAQASGFEEATWPNVLRLAERLYPSVATKLEHARTDLMRFSIEQIQAQAPAPFAVTERAGEKDPNFITLARLEKSDGELWKTRAFLYHVLHLNELFSGDGYTRTPSGERGLKELVGANRRLDELDAVLIDLAP